MTRRHTVRGRLGLACCAVYRVHVELVGSPPSQKSNEPDVSRQEDAPGSQPNGG